MLSNAITKSKTRKILLLSIPLILSAFTHLWNAAQFPSFHPDEGVYIRRSLHIASGLGLQDPSSRFDHSQDSITAYDHPYFGPIFLSFVFKILNYPQSLSTQPDQSSMEQLFATPRLIMGVLAVVDTFLVYRISERRFNSAVALIASLLFAVMPINWYTRRIVLDSIMLPFSLLSIMLALELSRSKYVHLIAALSGVSLGIAIFTKIASFSFIPLIGFLIYCNINARSDSTKPLKILILWILPVILVPSIWPGYAFVSGDLTEWIDGISWQALDRYATGKLLSDTGDSWFRSDPVLLVLGTIGIIYLTIKREYIAILWAVPYIVILYLVGWVTHFHLILVIPILCISSAKLIHDLPTLLTFTKKIRIVSSLSNYIARSRLGKITRNRITSILVCGIVLFGLISTTLLISNNLSYVQLQSASYISNEIVKDRGSYLSTTSIKQSDNLNNSDPDHVTIISSPVFSWVWKYVFNHKYSFSHVRESVPIKTQNVILLVDSTYKHVVSKVEGENETQVNRLMNIYNNTDIVALFKELPVYYKMTDYPFTGMDSAGVGSRLNEIRANY